MGKTVIVTGASKGIGAATAILFAEKGYNVVINYNSSAGAALLLQKSLTQRGLNVIAHKADVSKKMEVELMVKEAVYKFGEVDILINNAGVSGQSLFTDISEYDWDEMINVNLKGVFNCCQAVLPGMIRKKHGRIINISSMWGVTGASCEVHYSAAKAGVIGLTKALAKEVAPSGITVNAIAPGIIDTSMNAHLTVDELADFVNEIPVGRMGTTTEVAQLAMYLAGDDAEYITGQVIGQNGGYVI